MPDEQGEYVEIRLDDYRADSLYVRFEEKTALAYRFPRGANRMVLVHDSTLCPKRDSLACGLLGAVSLPNSRESYWRVWAGTCQDSVMIPSPKAGQSLQRVGESDEWTFTAGTFGTADPGYEFGILDCGLSGASAKWLPESGWSVRGFLTGCDTSIINIEVLDLGAAGGWKRSQKQVSGQYALDIPARGSAWVRLFLPSDAAPSNDTLDTLFVTEEKPPVVVSEVHHCPEEPMPEWVEIYNGTRYAFPLSRLRFCGRGGAWGNALDSLQSYESLLITKDTLALREQLGFKDVRIVYAALGYLNNTAGDLKLCFDETLVDSVSWSKNTVSCPSGFNPQIGRAENTPGYQRHDAKQVSEEPFTYKLSSRVVQKRGGPLRVSVTSEFEVQLLLLDSAGHRVWKSSVPPVTSAWQELPVVEYCKVGVCYVSLSAGSFEKVVGIVVRP